MSVDFYISELLFANDCVILPGFGGFVTSYAPAKIHPVNHTFYPPSKSILFNSKLTRDDGLLLDFISSEEKITYSRAKSEVASYVQALKNTIQKGKKVELDKVGVFFLDKKQNLLFDPDTSINYLEESFNLPSIVMHPIDRKSRHQRAEKAFIDRKPESANMQNRRKVLYASMAAVPVLLLIGWFVFIGLPKTDLTQKSGMVSLPDYEVSDNQPVDQPADTKIETEKDPPIKTLNFEEPKASEEKVITPEIKPSKKYYIIGGSFQSEANASKLVATLRTKGYDAEHAGLSRKGLFAVAYFSTFDKEEALVNLTMIRRDDNPSAWLLRK